MVGMIRLLKDLIHGEPHLALGIIATATGSWTAALVTSTSSAVPKWLAVVTPIATALAAYYAPRNGNGVGRHGTR